MLKSPLASPIVPPSTAGSASVPAPTQQQFLTFALGTLPLMMPADSVVKVVGASPTVCHNLREAGMVPAGSHTIRWLNLQQLLSHDTPPPPQQFLVVMRDLHSQLWGMLVDTLPNLISLSPEQLQLIPAGNNHHGIMALASHVWFVEQQRIYVLKPDTLLKFSVTGL